MAPPGSPKRKRPSLVAVPHDGDGDADADGGRDPASPDADADDARPADGRPASSVVPRDGERRSDVDEWGRSQHLRDLLAKFYDPIYDHWLRVEWEGFEKIPREGGALMVANHAGAIPADAPSIMHGIERELGRPVYGLADEVFKKVPVVNVAWSRLGGVQAHPDNAYRLLREQQQLVMVFPEGSKGPGKLYSERYRCAASAGAASCRSPCGRACRSSRWRSSATRRRCRSSPRSPPSPRRSASRTRRSRPTWRSGPIGMWVPFPAKMRIRVLDPVELDVLPDQPRYSRSRIMDTSEDIRHAIQEELYDMLRRRRSVWSG